MYLITSDFATTCVFFLSRVSGFYIFDTVDIDASYEDQNFIKELLEQEICAKEIQIVPPKNLDVELLDGADLNFESVDTIVISHLESIESTTMDKNELIKIYQGL